jgi:hypothetical protein
MVSPITPGFKKAKPLALFNPRLTREEKAASSERLGCLESFSFVSRIDSSSLWWLPMIKMSLAITEEMCPVPGTKVDQY